MTWAKDSVTANVIHMPARTKADTVFDRLNGVLAIFQAIRSAELLAALPDCEIARQQHLTALSLLAVAERELCAAQRSARSAEGIRSDASSCDGSD